LHQIVQWDPSERKQDAKADRLVEAEILTRYRVHQLPANAHLEFFLDAQGERVAGGRIYDAHIAEIARRAGSRTVLTDNRRHFTVLPSAWNPSLNRG